MKNSQHNTVQKKSSERSVAELWLETGFWKVGLFKEGSFYPKNSISQEVQGIFTTKDR